MLLECLAATAVFALTCGAVLLFIKVRGYDPQPPSSQRSLGARSVSLIQYTVRCVRVEQ
jgi:hypothetical protein